MPAGRPGGTRSGPAKRWTSLASAAGNRAGGMNKLLYLPMEIASRELDSRLLLSVIALTHGFEVVIGQKWLIESNIRRMPPGIYLSKTMTRRDAESLARARAHGYLTAA